MIKAYVLYWKNMVNFKDRARRAHYWWPTVIQSVISLIVSFMLVPQVRFDEYGELASITGSGKTIMVIFPSVGTMCGRHCDAYLHVHAGNIWIQQVWRGSSKKRIKKKSTEKQKAPAFIPSDEYRSF